MPGDNAANASVGMRRGRRVTSRHLAWLGKREFDYARERMRSWLALSTLAVMAAVAACAHDGRAPMGCGMTPMVDPGILIIPGIDLKVRDPYGRAQAIGTTYFVQTNTGTDSATWSADTLDIYTAFDQTG